MKRPLPRDVSPATSSTYPSYVTRVLWICCVLLCYFPISSLAFQPAFLPTAASISSPRRHNFNVKGSKRRTLGTNKRSLLKGLHATKEDTTIVAETQVPKKVKKKKKKKKKKKAAKKKATTKKTSTKKEATKKKATKKKKTTTKKSTPETTAEIAEPDPSSSMIEEVELEESKKVEPEILKEVEQPKPSSSEGEPQTTQQMTEEIEAEEPKEVEPDILKEVDEPKPPSSIEEVGPEESKEVEPEILKEVEPEMSKEVEEPKPPSSEEEPQITTQQMTKPKSTNKSHSPKNNNNNQKSNPNARRHQPNKRWNNNSKNNNISFAEAKALNQKITSCTSAKEVLAVLASTKGALTSPAGGGKLNSVNFSTAIHRIAQFLNRPPQRGNNSDNNKNPHQALKRIRAECFIDPRFALFLCSLAEALGGVSYNDHRSTISFGSREVSNIAWALAKVRIAPPQSDSHSPLLFSTNYKTMLLDTAKQVRFQVLQGAKARTRDKESERQKDDAHYAGLWVPSEALLCGQMIDTIGIQVDLSQRSAGGEGAIDVRTMAFQENANLLWACAKADRASSTVFEQVIQTMVTKMEAFLAKKESGEDDGVGANQRGRNGRDAPTLQPQEWSNSIWAFATAQVTGEGQVRLLKFLANTLETQQGFQEMFKPQELSNTAWSVAKLLSEKGELDEGEADAAITILRHVAMEVSKRASEFKTQELSNTLWGFATLGFGSSSTSAFAELSASLNNYVVLSSNDAEGDEGLVRQATDAILKCATQKLQWFKAQELNNLAWSLARLGRKDATSAVEAIGTELWRGKRWVTPQDIGTTLWSMANLECFNEEIYRGIASRLSVDRAHQFKPQELSNVVWAMATAEVTPTYPDMFDTVLIPPQRQFSGPLHAIDDPVTLCFGVAAQELMRRPFEFKSQEIKDVLWSFSRIGIRHPDLFKATAEHLVGPDKPKGQRSRPRGLDDFSPQGLGNMAWAFAKQAQLVSDVNERSDLSASVLSSTGKMAVYATSFFDIGEILVQRLFSAIVETDLRVHENLSTLKPQDISNTAWAMAVLGMRHSAFLEAAKQQLIERTSQYVRGQGQRDMTYFKSQELANVLWAFAILNFPGHGLGSNISPYMIKATVGSMEDLAATGIARAYKRQELANIAWSCAVFNEYPSSLMKLLYCGLVGIGNERDPQHLRNCFRDGGLQREAIMSVIYLQLALELEGEANDLTLPENFPTGWSQQALSGSGGNLGDMGFGELKLTTSKLQRDVSAALGRIGFDYVEEHVIPLTELLENGGLGVANAPIEVISIDIANVDSRIAIEVDGPAHYVADIESVPSEGGYAKVNNGRMQYYFKMNDDRHDLNGPTALKQRLLQQMGWKAINIPFWEWFDLNGDEALEEEYCRRLVGELVH